MELTFLGTSAGSPTKHRNVTGVALARNGEWDLFDCGEATQHRIQETRLSLHKLRRVFISHLHGDHCFGLFGLLGSRGIAGGAPPLTVYGPPGLEEMVRTVLQVSESYLDFELSFVEVGADGAMVVDDQNETITAFPLVHRVLSFAWLIEEADRPGRFDVGEAQRLGVSPGPDFARLQRGESVSLADGTVVEPSRVVGDPRPGTRLIIAGDNADPAGLLDRTGPVDVLVHEATFTEDVVARTGVDHGHSTAARTAAAAHAGDVEHLVLTHFSPRYGPPGASGATIDDVRAEAEAQFGGKLTLANDLDVITLR